MKKFYFLLVIFVFSIYSLNAQTTIYTTNFDGLTSGSKLAAQAGSPWTTWSLAPGGTEDPSVSTTQAHSSANSVNIVNGNDCVLQFFDKTTGRFKIEWYMYVESGKLGYFNILSDFNASSSLWAFQVFIRNDSIFIDANGSNVKQAVFASNTWTKLDFIIDLDDDYATYYQDDVELVSYQWSKGAQGTDNSLKLDGIDFYGWDNDGAGTAGYYIDDIKFDSVSAPGTTLPTLSANLNVDDIDISWTAATPTPTSYNLNRNGIVVNNTTGLTYTDVHPWPDTYRYAVRAQYAGQGYSHASNIDSVTITGGVTRDLVLMEKGTSIYCVYCPYAAQGFKSLIETNHKNAVGIAYHPTSLWGSFEDAYGNSASETRLQYYNVSGFPTVISDGKYRIDGVTGTTNQYSVYLAWYNDRISKASFHNIDLSIVPTGTDTYTATITAEETFNAFSTVKLYAVLTESNIAASWYGQTEVDYVCRAMYPDGNGSVLNFATQNPQTLTFNFSTTGYVKDNCQFVVFIQDPASQLVSQTVKMDMSAIGGVDEIKGNSISIYPNPTSDYFIANTSGNGQLELFDITGKLVLKRNISKTSETYDIRNLTKGVYVVKVTSKENSFSEKLIIE